MSLASDISFVVPRDLAINSNVRLHRAVAARRAAALRGIAASTTTTQCHHRIELHCEIATPTRRRFDAPNMWPTVKPLVDGMTDAGWWEDDNSEHILAHTFTHATEPSPRDTFLVALRVEPARAQAPDGAAWVRVPRHLVLNSNQRMHYRQRAARASSIREIGRALVPPQTFRACHLSIFVAPPTRRRLDPPNLWPTVKPLVDGMTDAGWWEDDNSRIILSHRIAHGGMSGERDAFRIGMLATAI